MLINIRSIILPLGFDSPDFTICSVSCSTQTRHRLGIDDLRSNAEMETSECTMPNVRI